MPYVCCDCHSVQPASNRWKPWTLRIIGLVFIVVWLASSDCKGEVPMPEDNLYALTQHAAQVLATVGNGLPGLGIAIIFLVLSWSVGLCAACRSSRVIPTTSPRGRQMLTLSNQGKSAPQP